MHRLGALCLGGYNDLLPAGLSMQDVKPGTCSDPVDTLQDQGKVASWIAEITGKPESEVRSRLRAEYEAPGSTVAQALRDAGIEFYSWSDDLARFYEETDAFLYELVVWNQNRLKGWLRRAVAKHLEKRQSGALKVLSIGDGLGFDSLCFARAGHRMTYYEVPGYTEAFARRNFADAAVDITVLTKEADIPRGAFDTVISLDVLEHLPSPPDAVRQIAEYLRPGGRLIVNAPFAVIHPTVATHLESNRKYSGSLSLFTQAGFRLLDGEIIWAPLVLQRVSPGQSRPRQWTPKRLALRLGGCALAVGRYPILPLGSVSTRQRLGRWFSEDSGAAAAPG